jgi:hypothetical protein
VLLLRNLLADEASKELLPLFGFPHYMAPGEAEAECAGLQRNSFIDAVMGEDVDAIIFGSSITLRRWSQERRRGPRSLNGVSVHRSKILNGVNPTLNCFRPFICEGLDPRLVSLVGLKFRLAVDGLCVRDCETTFWEPGHPSSLHSQY